MCNSKTFTTMIQRKKEKSKRYGIKKHLSEEMGEVRWDAGTCLNKIIKQKYA